MSKDIIDDVLKNTNGRILYIEQLIQIMNEFGFSPKESYSIIKFYAKKKSNKVREFENHLINSFGNDIVEYLVDKIKYDCWRMRWKSQEEALRVNQIGRA